ncbi:MULTISPECIES: hypothetical protein [Tenacibaculum]|uniref:SnoaL-like domain-containing protein n=3 Tax=Tenacibaculum TaxID=104267 RepID=A0AAE9MS24_9FLAO|nr:hypothetical protein [Tenacibaculum mesophilum]UTD16645.1 hypothetical protein HER15_14640 [Tenacibaculum mesophilum]GFD75988.1 hypothetical protein KUL113_54080 [Tenacibaculum sp. KUL113]GFD83214.1 hypothetical protein KUL118_60760 [Tenacibaculum sp. KUL118]
MNTKTIEYEQLMHTFRNRKFTKNDIKSFVYKIFSMYERATCNNEHVSAEAFNKLIADDIFVDFPAYKNIHSKSEFLEWHRWIHDLLISDDHDIEKIDVSYLSNGKYMAQFIVHWRALFKDNTYSDLRVDQQWIMREDTNEPLPIIERYLVTDATNFKQK